MLIMGADSVWQWTGANGVGYGDPLCRDAAAVRADVAAGAMSAETALRVYAVGSDDSSTDQLRAERLAARLAAAVAPATPPRIVHGVVRPVAGELAMYEGAFVSLTGRALLAPAGGNYKDGCAVLERPLHGTEPEFATREGRAGWGIVYREYLCPITGLRIDSEIVRAGDPVLHDIVLEASA